jgi:hypothetical protein
MTTLKKINREDREGTRIGARLRSTRGAGAIIDGPRGSW